MTVKKEKKANTPKVFVFYHRTVSTFAKPHKANPKANALQKRFPLPIHKGLI